MSYVVKEIFYSLQGEGAQVGRPAVFCRFAGCNLWSGWEKDRGSAVCRFCDTDFVGTNGRNGGVFADPQALASAIADQWRMSEPAGKPFVVCTGGEPLLQMDEPFVNALHDLNFEVAIETNGTLLPPPGVDWICVSPKAGAELVLQHGNELKLIYHQPGAEPELFIHLPFHHFFLQPMDGPRRDEFTRAAVQYCLEHPRWRLSLQVHKLLGLP